MRYLPFPLLFLILHCTSVRAQNTALETTETLRAQHLRYVADSTTWDRKMLADDLEAISFYDDVGPMTAGIFPVPDYDLLSEGKFDGVFSGGNTYRPIEINGKSIVYQTFGAGANPHQLPYLDGANNQVFFTLITVTDTIDAEDYTTVTSLISSRNHPDITGEGIIKNKLNQVEFITFWTAENDRFALVNLRLFDLSHGHIIVVAPLKDGTFRSLQINEPPRGKDATDQLIKEDVLRRPAVIEFLTGPQVIGGR
ncbi:hypothetical protein [Neolewinella antarctica]|uniref:Uncharacterized protein n=1 Tax=Neolewinella antarctica TaxID=442734 RepID=A0ABX0XDR4_9BACT|nr:hypothetical protein [Neolewinella antarctica]NJC27043.1 hypothetical protein [Neolewinella antarctica]